MALILQQKVGYATIKTLSLRKGLQGAGKLERKRRPRNQPFLQQLKSQPYGSHLIKTYEKLGISY
jgi:hypothetical protein